MNNFENIFKRTEMLIGTENIKKLKTKTVAVFGLGGVGSFVVEALARSGIGKLVLIDNDEIFETNLNRQLFALRSTLGQKKTEAAKIRIADINPDCVVETHARFFCEETKEFFDFSKFDYVVDAIDSVNSKVLLAKICRDCKIQIVSSMSTGNKLNPLEFEIADISQTSVCPIAKIMRSKLRKEGIEKLKVVYSKEAPKKEFHDTEAQGKQAIASISFVPSVAGLLLASEVIKDLIQ